MEAHKRPGAGHWQSLQILLSKWMILAVAVAFWLLFRQWRKVFKYVQGPSANNYLINVAESFFLLFLSCRWYPTKPMSSWTYKVCVHHQPKFTQVFSYQTWNKGFKKNSSNCLFHRVYCSSAQLNLMKGRFLENFKENGRVSKREREISCTTFFNQNENSGEITRVFRFL